MIKSIKPLIFVGTSQNDIRGFGKNASISIGTELFAVQMGSEPTDWKPIRTIGVGVREIRTHDGKEYRTIYIAKFSEAIYVLHSFVKKSRTTSKKDIQIAKDRLDYVNRMRNKSIKKKILKR